MSKTKLRPCPFCGGDEIEAGTVGYAYCINCDAEGPHTKTKATAIRAWNDRPGNTINEQIGCLVDIRRVVGDPEAKLMHDELVEKIAALVEENKSLRREAAKGSKSAQDWEIERLRADAALGRAVRRLESAGLWSGVYGWFVLNEGLPGCGKRRSSHGNTPEAALRAAGLMKEEK